MTAGDGSYLRIGRLAFFSGRIVFGASASFGTGAAAVIGFPFDLDMNHATGKGHFQQVDGSGNPLGNPIPFFLTGGSGSSMQIRPIVANGSNPSNGPAASAIGTPAQSSYLIFDVTAVPA